MNGQTSVSSTTENPFPPSYYGATEKNFSTGAGIKEIYTDKTNREPQPFVATIDNADDFEIAEEYHEVSSVAPPQTLEEMEKQMIKQTLEKYRGKRKSAAEELKISERTLYRKIKEYGIE